MGFGTAAILSPGTPATPRFERNSMSLTAPERETIITFSDADDTATIHTHQRRVITKLKNNPAAEQVEDISFEGSPGAVFELPAQLISFRSGRRRLTEAQRQAAVANLRREARAATRSPARPDRGCLAASKRRWRVTGDAESSPPPCAARVAGSEEPSDESVPRRSAQSKSAPLLAKRRFSSKGAIPLRQPSTRRR
jgi:hypothetical protein